MLAEAGGRLNLLEPDQTRLFLAASALTMLITPFALRFGPQVAAGAARLRALERLLAPRFETSDQAPVDLSEHVLVLGYGVGGEMLAEALRASRIPCGVVDANPERIRAARALGRPAWYGDATSAELLERARVSHASQVALLLNDPEATRRAVRAARGCAPRARIVARARYLADVPRLLAAGADSAVAQEVEASLEVIAQVLRGARLGAADVGAGVEAALALTPPAERARAPLSGLRMESFGVPPSGWIAGRTLGDARLRTLTRASVVGLSRDGATLVHPDPEDRVEPGDLLYLVGDAAAVAAAMGVLAHGPDAPAAG